MSWFLNVFLEIRLTRLPPFLVALCLSVFYTHAFSIASSPQSASDRHSQNTSEVQTVSFFVRSHAGFTRKLSCYTSNNNNSLYTCR